ncbi:DegT/DnrJ/EryC1/StrS family aminotransferase [Halorientalis pallida]|uniref:DegT/DnrJ/EryC1/StrS family aminotransferase n=1 Tax=Halorientalis pallida TaxID=2479928 RepID=UPI003C6F7DEC
MPEDIPLFEISWDVDDIKNVVDSVGRGSWWAKGPYVTEFEERLETYVGVEHAVIVNSGTTAIYAALEALDVGEGDEVIVPSFTQQATVNAVKLAGGDPLFVDIDRETYGLDPAAVEAAISPDTVGMIPVHVYGSVCRIDALRDIADDHDLWIVEDAAEALGADRNGTMAGTVGEAAALSFCQNKIVATGEGGAVLTDDEDIAATTKLFRSHGRASTDYFGSSKSGRHVAVGGNFRMPDVVAALGCSQMAKVEQLIDGRREAALRMNEAFEDTDGVDPHTLPDGRHVYQFYAVTFDPDIDRDAVIEFLADRGISSKVYWDPPVHLSDYYESPGIDLPVTEEISSRVLSLPIHPELSPAATERIIDGVRGACDELW